MSVQHIRPILVTAKEAAALLGMPTHAIYELSRNGGPLERRYKGEGRRNFNLTYDSVEAYANGLPTEPVEAAS